MLSCPIYFICSQQKNAIFCLLTSVSQPVCRELLPSVPSNSFGPYFYYSFVENKMILVANLLQFVISVAPIFFSPVSCAASQKRLRTTALDQNTFAHNKNNANTFYFPK